MRVFVIFILIFGNCLKKMNCFNLNFHEQHYVDIEYANTQIFKRELMQFFDKSSYTFDGLIKIESVPIVFPIDICILKLEGIKYATALHNGKNGIRHFAVYRMNLGDYRVIFDKPKPKAIRMDCMQHAGRGYVALVYNITAPVEHAKEGSPIYEIAGEHIHAVQYFAAPNLRAMYLRVSGNELTLLQSFENTKVTPNLHCPFFKWSGTSFNKLGRIPCSNARRLEPFAIDYENYVAVANYADQRGRTSIHSEIYKYEREKRTFQLFQRIQTNGAVDVKYFSVPRDDIKRNHFLVFGNSIGQQRQRDGMPDPVENLEADSIFYVFDKGQFVPYQSLSLYAVEHLLPVQNTDAEKFLLLVACNKQDIKIYNLNDWKFEESTIQFTEGALGRGVVNMRTFEENDNSYLVIANEEMADNETNIFQPIFKQDAHANAMRQTIIEWATKQSQGLANINVDKLQNSVELKLKATPEYSKAQETVTLDKNTIIKTILTETLNYAHLKMNRKKWLALNFAKKALDVLERRMHKRPARQLGVGHETESYEFDQIYVHALVVREKLHAQHINGINRKQPIFVNVQAIKVFVNGDYKVRESSGYAKNATIEPLEESAFRSSTTLFNDLHSENLIITGQLNGRNWTYLLNSTLKSLGLQFIKAPLNIGNLRAETFVVNSNEISDKNLAQLITTSSGDYIVQQDVQFAAPVTAKKLLINERLNNIHVYKHKFDVLLKYSNEVQIIEGTKHFVHVKVLEPIVTSGQIVGTQLRSMSPVKTIRNNLTLHGDYAIAGDVTIDQFVSVDDITLANTNHTATVVLENGIRIDETLEIVNLKFVMPLKANNSQLSFVNTIEMQELVQTNIDGIQLIAGTKQFANDLEIQGGFCEVKNLNGRDIEELGERLLMKQTNQSIKMQFYIGKILAKSLEATNVTLNQKPIRAYFCRIGDQNINGTLQVNKLITRSINALNLYTNGKIFDQTVADIYQKKSQNTPDKLKIFQTKRKFHGSIYVQQLLLNSTVNYVAVAKLERKLKQLDGNIKYVGENRFEHKMNITHLNFKDNINGVKVTKFGRYWLQREGEQNFTVSQTLADVMNEQVLFLYSNLNGHPLEDFYSGTYALDTNEHISAAIFVDPIQIQGAFVSDMVNSLHIPEDILYRSSTRMQILDALEIFVNDQLNIYDGDVQNITIVNDYELSTFARYISGYGFDTLHLESVYFDSRPHYKTLNQHDLQRTLDGVWLVNENVELDQQNIALTNGNFNGLFDFEGSINNIQMTYLESNYWSLTRLQKISTQINFVGQVDFDTSLQANNLQIETAIVDIRRNETFNFDDFGAYTLKKSGTHIISGSWRIASANVGAELQNVHINNLNLADDVLRNDIIVYEIIGSKHFNSATIRKLNASSASLVQGVNIRKWINDAIYIYENYTINGVTTLATVNLYNDLLVYGDVNKLKFDENTILLRDREQHIQGDIHVRNALGAKAVLNRILTLNIEYLYTKTINERTVTPFMNDNAQVLPILHIQGHLIFTLPLPVHDYQVGVFEEHAGHYDFIRIPSIVNLSINWIQLKRYVHKLKSS